MSDHSVGERDFRRNFLALAAGIAATFCAVAFTNYVVDPYQFFRRADHSRFAQSVNGVRYQIPGVIRNFPFDALVVGGSAVTSFEPEMFASYKPEIKVQNLTVVKAGPLEVFKAIQLAFDNKKLKVVFWEIGYMAHQSASKIDRDFPYCLYDTKYAAFPYCYLLNLDFFKESLLSFVDDRSIAELDFDLKLKKRLEKGNSGSAEQAGTLLGGLRDRVALWLAGLSHAAWRISDPGAWQKYPLSYPMNYADYACKLRERIGPVERVAELTAAAERRLGEIDYSRVRARAAEKLNLVLPIVDAHPDTLFVFFFPTVYLPSFWELLASDGTLGFRNYMTDYFAEYAIFKEELIKRKNVEVYNLQADSELSVDHSLYRDYFHVEARGAQRMIDNLVQKRFRVTSLAADMDMIRAELRRGAALVRTLYGQWCAALDLPQLLAGTAGPARWESIDGIDMEIGPATSPIKDQRVMRLTSKADVPVRRAVIRFQRLKPDSTYRLSVWVKPESENSVMLLYQPYSLTKHAHATYDLVQRTVTVRANVKNSGIETGPDGWLKLWLEFRNDETELFASTYLYGYHPPATLTFGGIVLEEGQPGATGQSQ